MMRLPALIAAITVIAGPVAAQVSIRPGQTVQGELSASDPKLDDGSHYDCFAVQTREGQALQIDQMSEAFDSFLTVGTGTCTELTNSQSDDDGGDGLNARLVRMGDGGRLIILVNSLAGGSTGAYQLRVSETSGGSAAGQTTTSLSVGQTARGDLSASDPTLTDGSHYDCFQVQTRRGQTLQIDQSSSDFDSFLSIGSGSCGALNAVASDDDSGGGLNSRLIFEGDGSVLTIRANSVSRGETGRYELKVSEASARSSPEPFANVTLETLRASRPTSLPRVDSDWGTEPATCLAAYMAMVDMVSESVAPTGFGNASSINYEPRVATLRPRVPPPESAFDISNPYNSLDLYMGNFKSMALVGAIGIAPNGQPNGGRPLAEYLTVLGECDREYGFSPVTAY